MTGLDQTVFSHLKVMVVGLKSNVILSVEFIIFTLSADG